MSERSVRGDDAQLGGQAPAPLEPSGVTSPLSSVPGEGDAAAALPVGSSAEAGHFDHYARLTRRLLRSPVALVSLVEARRQIFAGASGLPAALMTARQTPLSHSFCAYVVQDEKPLVIEDARTDARLAGNPAIAELDVIAYLGCPLRDASGRTIGSLCAVDSKPRSWSADDIDTLEDLAMACSAELQITQRLAEDGEQLARSIFSATDVAMAFYDSQGELVLANEPARRVADAGGFQLDQWRPGGDHVYDRPHGSTPVSADEQVVAKALRGDLTRREVQWLGPPGRQVVVSALARGVPRGDGSPWGTLIALHDITELALALQVKDELIATVSHELRTPLTAILGYVEILLDEPDTAGFLADGLATIERNALTLRERVDELLGSGERSRVLRLETTDVRALARDVVSRFSDSARRSDVVLDLETREPCWADVDAERFAQLLENLVSNAIKFTPEGGRVTVRVHTRSDAVVVEVVDTGIGMTPEELDRAFEKFWRSEGSLTGAVQGVGIGLSVVHEVADAHGGSVQLASDPGHGTSVTVSVPRGAHTRGQGGSPGVDVGWGASPD